MYAGYSVEPLDSLNSQVLIPCVITVIYWGYISYDVLHPFPYPAPPPPQRDK